SVVLLKRAVNLGNTEALVDLTNIYLLGRGSVPIDFDTARDLALKLIDKEHGYGHSVIAMLYSYGLGVAEDQTKAMLHYSMAAILNDPHGTMAMAYRAKMEVMISRSCSHAHQLYKALASNESIYLPTLYDGESVVLNCVLHCIVAVVLGCMQVSSVKCHLHLAGDSSQPIYRLLGRGVAFDETSVHNAYNEH
ncbi:hypothetical protein SARC_05314, partial [Sphaeroforma arctica JP610]